MKMSLSKSSKTADLEQNGTMMILLPPFTGWQWKMGKKRQMVKKMKNWKSCLQDRDHIPAIDDESSILSNWLQNTLTDIDEHCQNR